MQVILSAIIFAVTALIVASAPTLSEGQVPANTVIADQEKNYRDKRSQYQYVSPCAAAAAAAASSPIPAIAPPAYANLSPYNAYAAPHSYYRMPQYRSAEFDPEHEIMSFSDMDHMMSEHMPMARYGYTAPTPSHAPPTYSASLVPPPTLGNVYSVFHNANTGGCGLPVLFSCRPSVAIGDLVSNPAQYAHGDSYRGVEAIPHHESQDHHEVQTVHDHLNPVHDQTHAIMHQ